MSGNNSNRNARGPTYTNEEVTYLFEIMREVLPIGEMEWERVHETHLLRFPGCTLESLKRKFYQLANKPMPTGEANCPAFVREAKRIVREITGKSELEAFANDDEDHPNPVNPADGQVPPHNNNVVPPVLGDVAPAPPVQLNIPNRNNQGSSDSSVSGDNAPPVVRGNLRRLASIRRNRNEEDMSISEFFRYSMMQREQDRREREECEERERAVNERNDRFFRDMMMAVLLNGRNIQNDVSSEAQD